MKNAKLLPLCLALLAGCSVEDRTLPLSAEETVKTFQISEDFRVEVFAAEPDVTDPVELVFDEQGRAWVAEMRDYPSDPPKGDPYKSRVRVLEDRDGDGRIDHSTIFAEELPHVKSVLPWNGGLLVSSAPDILYLKDTDGDLKADEKTVLFTGFTTRVDPEGRVNNLRFGIDNWIYVSNDSQAGEIEFSRKPGVDPVSVLGTDFRFRLDRDLFESASGATRFGQTFDIWGHRFFSQAGRDVNHVVMARRYLQRNPFLTAPKVSVHISQHDQRIFQLTPPEPWRETRTRMRQRRYKEIGMERELQSSGFFTGATGATVYTGDTFPEAYRGNVFTGEVAGNLIHRDILSPEGVTFTANRPQEEQDKEFLASTHRWFRPANFTVGPDGNLYVVDICREFVETPASIPEPIKKGKNFFSGTDLGRIYRIVPKGHPSGSMTWPALHQAEIAGLVENLAHANQWWRLTSQRLLLERHDPSAIPLLKEMVVRRPNPLARLHALYALEGANALDASLISLALDDSEAGVREHAIMLAEDFPELLPKLTSLVSDPSPRVLFQLALSLGQFQGKQVHQAFRRLVEQNGEDKWQRTAILSSEPGSSLDLLKSMAREPAYFESDSAGKASFLEELAAVIGARNREHESQRLIGLIAHNGAFKKESWQVPALRGFGRGLELGHVRRLEGYGAERALKALLSSSSGNVREAAAGVVQHFRIPSLLAAARKQEIRKEVSTPDRSTAIRSLAGARFQEVRELFAQLLASSQEPELKQVALKTLTGFEDPQVSQLILANWSTFSPEDRKQAIGILLNHSLRVIHLLDALEGGKIERAALDHQQQEILRQHPDPKVQKRALQILRREASNREAVIESYSSALALEPNPLNGRELYNEECAGCHSLKAGTRVGPALQGSVQGHTREQLLFDILNPSGNILSLYRSYIVTTKDGGVFGGIIAGETPGTLTIRSGPGEEETILRGRIAEIRASDVSLMPEGFEDNLSRQEIADVIAFMQAGYLIEDGQETDSETP